MAGPELVMIDGCPCGAGHVLRREEAERVQKLIEQTEPTEVVGENGARVMLPPIAVVLHGRS
jgi:hypothetical protein